MSLTLFAAAAVLVQTPSIDQYLQSSFKSATFTVTVGKANQVELQKINKDFANSYRFKSMDVWLKEPFKIRMESKVDDSSLLMVINGSTRKISIPKAHISQRENLAEDPGKRQTALDFGFLTPALFNNYYQAKFVRTERGTGEQVFDITYVPSLNDKTRHRVWIDPNKKVMTKRQWYANRGGHLMATFEYSNFAQVNGVWVAQSISVNNAENKQAGTSSFRDVKVNPSIDDSMFSVS
jgi:outer membrane lipoprotein-sorting protein